MARNEIELLPLEQLVIEQDPFLKQVWQTAPSELRNIQISEAEGSILNFLLTLIGAKSVLELGTLAGHSTLWMAKAIGKQGRIVTIEKDEVNYNIAKQNFHKARFLGYDCSIELLNADAQDIIPNLPYASFDAIFIDANKAKYPFYFKCAENLIRKGGLIIADNTLLLGYINKPIDEVPARFRKLREAMLEFHKLLSDPLRYRTIIIPTQEGMTVALKLF